ncbi:MAG: hypothetical protein M3680_27865 [Myxococcota bacterium]|nr:hypothetical protein [Myxococcota bacterium]
MIDPNDPNYVPKDHRPLGIGLTVAAALLLIYACFSHRWLENTQYRGTRFGFSLLSFEACMDGKCEGMSNFKMMAEARERKSDSASSAFAPMGLATLVLLGLSAIGLLVTAGIAIKKQRPDLRIAPTTVALLGIMGALLTGCVFVATKPGGVGGVGVGLGFWAFGIGAVLGIAGAQMLNKVIKPIDPDLAVDAY